MSNWWYLWPFRSFSVKWGLNLLTFDLKAWAVDVLFRKLSSVTMSSKIFLIIFSIWFILSSFMLQYWIHLDLSFVQADKYGSVCILLHADIQLNYHHLLKILSFLSLYTFDTFVKHQVSVVSAFISESNSIPFINLSVFMPILCSFVCLFVFTIAL